MAFQLPHGVLPDKPQPPGYPAQQAFRTQIHSDMPRRLPTASGPFPGVIRAPHSSADQTDSCARRYAVSAAPDAAILAQHAFGGPQDDNAYSRRDGSTRYQASDATAQILSVHNLMDISNKTGMQSSSQQLSSKAPYSGHYVNDHNSSSNENQFPGVGAAGPRYVTPIPDPLLLSNSLLSETTATLNARAENAYVSFDEWQAQVRAKQLRMPHDRFSECNSSTSGQYVANQQPLGWLSDTLLPGNVAGADGGHQGARS